MEYDLIAGFHLQQYFLPLTPLTRAGNIVSRLRVYVSEAARAGIAPTWISGSSKTSDLRRGLQHGEGIIFVYEANYHAILTTFPWTACW